MAVDWNRLLKYIVQNLVMSDRRLEAQLDANAGRDVGAELQAISEDLDDDARRLAPAFAHGMELALNTQGPLSLEDSDPHHGDVVSALVRYLVSTDLAESQSSQLANGHYLYTFEIHWPRLREVARAAGVNIDNQT
jgi:hypothetical protein